MKSFNYFKNTIFENLEKWKYNWIKDINKMQKFGDIVPPHEILEYVTSFHERDYFDDTDFYERIMNFEYFKFEMIEIEDLELDKFHVDSDLIENYCELYKETKTYPPLVINENKNIIDGAHRLNALYECGLKNVKCYVGYK